MKPREAQRSAFRATAVRAAVEAGRILRERAHRGVMVTAKGDADITTDADRDCEQRIVEIVRERHPEHTVLGEEGTSVATNAPYVWIVDPLDGTKNFAHGYPRSAVSIALACRNEVLVGVVYNPHADELFVAENGLGATLNDAAIRVSKTDSMRRAMVASAIVYDGRAADRVHLERLARTLAAVEAVRSDGCAALDLCDVACGRFDAYFEPGLRAWDTAAGALIVREAGGTTTRFDGSDHDPFVPELVASCGHIHSDLLGVINAR